MEEWRERKKREVKKKERRETEGKKGKLTSIMEEN